MSVVEVVALFGRPDSGTVGWAIVMAVAACCCYATSAVLQEREAARPDAGGTAHILHLLRRPMWWVAVLATIAAAGLHIGALALGPLTLIQPLGVLTLVLALPLGARLAGRVVTRAEWGAAVAVALGLAAVLSVAPHRAPALTHSAGVVLGTAAVVAGVAAGLATIATRLPRRVAPVVFAVAAATCFGFASGMARMTVTGMGPLLVTGPLAVAGAVAGLALAQFAYRDGGLGAPLATLNLVDPMVAVIIGVTVLDEPLQLAPGPVALGLSGLVATSVGIWVLARAPAAGVAPAQPPDAHVRDGRPAG
ncbi:DMT family transporter [Pseudonocardia sp. CA-107938]|uniref:DMT family transporter n=1 Tax=Pseudonocardia sp. CA-107938 TaxID=3240021 RepID=UPI003D8EB4F8